MIGISERAEVERIRYGEAEWVPVSQIEVGDCVNLGMTDRLLWFMPRGVVSRIEVLDADVKLRYLFGGVTGHTPVWNDSSFVLPVEYYQSLPSHQQPWIEGIGEGEKVYLVWLEATGTFPQFVKVRFPGDKHYLRAATLVSPEHIADKRSPDPLPVKKFTNHDKWIMVTKDRFPTWCEMIVNITR